MKLSVLMALLVLGSVASAQTSGPIAAIGTLQRFDTTATWNLGSAKTADFDCDGQPDIVMLGSEKDKVVVGVVWATRTRQPQVLKFPVGRTSENGFCSKPAKLEVLPLDCRTSDGSPLPGCRVASGCKAFSIPNSDCPAFNFYWDSSNGGLAFWRP